MFNEYPYINLSDLNLDFLLKTIKDIAYRMDHFVDTNALTFADPLAWDITKQYKPNTIVLNDNAAYLAKIPVPYGVEITNAEYWLKIGDFDVSSELERRFNEFKAQTEANVTRIDFDVKHTERFTNKHYVLFGDSYTQGYTPDGVIESFAQKLKSLMNGYGAAFDVYGEGGVGFAKVSPQGHNFATLIGSKTADATVTDVLICGGFNDYDQEQSAIRTGIDNAYTQLNSKYPNARYYFFNIGETTNPTNRHKLSVNDRRVFAPYLARKKIGYVEGSYLILHNKSLFSSDTVHPNANGHSTLFECMANWFMTGQIELGGAYGTYYVGEEGKRFQVYVRDSGYTLNIAINNADINTFLNAGDSLAGNTTHAICTGSELPQVMPTGAEAAMVRIAAVKNTPDGKVYCFPLSIGIVSGGGLGMAIKVLNTAQTGYVTFGARTNASTIGNQPIVIDKYWN